MRGGVSIKYKFFSLRKSPSCKKTVTGTDAPDLSGNPMTVGAASGAQCWADPPARWQAEVRGRRGTGRPYLGEV